MRWLRPIPQDWIPWHLLLFVAFCAFGLTLRAGEQLPLHKPNEAVEFTNAMVDGAVSVILVAATISTSIVEGALIFAEKYLKHRYERGREEGHAEGVDEERQRWQEWNERRVAAEQSGEQFTDPAPSEESKSKEQSSS